MYSVPEALDKFQKSLELSSGDKEAILNLVGSVRESIYRNDAICQHNIMYSGSYKRKIAVSEFSDVDLFLVLNESRFYDTTAEPKSIILNLKEMLAEKYKGIEVRAQTCSVGMRFPGLPVDVVPAFENWDRTWIIPNKDANRWIRTNPAYHAKLTSDTNEKTQGKFKQMVKMMKYWNHTKRDKERGGKPLISFHIESMGYAAFDSYNPPDYVEGLSHYFKYMVEQYDKPCPDPSRLGPPINDGMEKRRIEYCGECLNEAHIILQKCKACLERRDIRNAHRHLAHLFGGKYMFHV